MHRQNSMILLSSCLALSCLGQAQAQSDESSETTVIRTTTTVTGADSPVVVQSRTLNSIAMPALSSSGNYLVVDPITGLLKGRFDPVAGLVDGRTLQAGLVIVDRPTGNVVAIIDGSGRAVDASVAPASDVLLVSIESRRKDLNRQIAEALNRGRLSSLEANALRAELERISTEESASRIDSGTITYRRALVSAYNLNSLSQRLYPTAVVTPIISPQFVVLNKQLTMVDNTTYRKLQLLQRIDDEYQAGRLSADNVSRLKSQLDQVSSLETRYRVDGELSASRSRTLSMKLDQVDTALGKNIANTNEKRARIGIRVN